MVISLRLPEALRRKLAAAAKARAISKSELIRRCLETYLSDAETRPTAWELGKDLFGCWDSGRGDLSARAKEIAREKIRAKHAKRSRR
jgi:Ribbon-helix-helix protein, copG family